MGFQKAEALLQKAASGQVKGFISPLALFEMIIILGSKNPEIAVKNLAYTEKILGEIPINSETTKRAAFNKIKNSEFFLSLADWVIIQTAIDNNLTAVSADKEWSKVKEAKVIVV